MVHKLAPAPHALDAIANISTQTLNIDDLYRIQDFLSTNAGLSLGSRIKIRFWIISSLMFIMGALHFITLIKNIFSRNYWLIERNKNGYLNPNIEVLVPLFSLLNGSLFLCSIILMNRDNGRYLSSPTMTIQMASYNALFYCAATRVWRTLSAIPLVPVQLTPHGTSLLSNGVPPFWFNTLVVLLYISFPVVTLPLSLKMCKDAGNLGEKVFILMPNLKLLIAQQQGSPTSTLPKFLLDQFEIQLESIHQVLLDVNHQWRIACGVYLSYTLSLFVLFVYASVRLYSTLTVQLRILTQARRRFARMASVGMISVEDDMTFDCTSQSIRSSKMYRTVVKSIRRLKAAIWIQCHAESELLEFWDWLDASSENAELERKAKMSFRYRTAVLWQSFSSGIIFMAFVVLTACLAFNAFGVPNRTSGTQAALITLEWSGWAWSVPGSVLALVTCGVAFAPHPASKATTQLPSSLRRQSPKENRFKTELSRTSTESDVVNLRPYGVSDTETRQESTPATTITGEIKKLGGNIWRKLWTSRTSPASQVSQIKRKVSCFSFSADEKSREQVVNQIPPGHGIDMPNQTAQGTPINHDHRFDSGNGLFPADQITSDINIIKSLRHQDA